ncbi:MAG: alpha/beta hydrolase [Clostridia bacterium]|nr:alpha/beta hydrolase [Clostridia bacterium]
MLIKTIELSEQYPGATLTTYVSDNSAELKAHPRKAIVVCPGGGYRFLSDREGEPIVKAFLGEGLNAFLLRYTVGMKGDKYPENPGASDYAPLIQAALAIKHIRENAEAYHIDPDQIFIIGFSAGGHLAASTGILWKTDAVQRALGASAEEPTEIGKPNGMLLSYPVITSGEYAHKGSIYHLCNTKTPTEEEMLRFSLEKHVDETSAPFFLWHTFSDKTVPIQNALLLADAYTKHELPFEMHVFPAGSHGLALANEETMSDKPHMIVPHVQGWISLAIRWIKDFGHFGPNV